MSRQSILDELGIDEDELEEAATNVAHRRRIVNHESELPPTFSVGDDKIHRFQTIVKEPQMAINAGETAYVITDANDSEVTMKDEQWNRHVVDKEKMGGDNYQPKVATDGTPIWRY